MSSIDFDNLKVDLGALKRCPYGHLLDYWVYTC
jgi:hypothetical protein